MCSLIYTACQAHVPYYIIICGLSGSIFSHCFTKQHNFQKHVKKHKMCFDFLYRKKCSMRMETDRMKLIAAFCNFAEVPNSYNTHVLYVQSSKCKDHPITCHHWHRNISPIVLNLVTRREWVVNTTLSHITTRKEPPPVPMTKRIGGPLGIDHAQKCMDHVTYWKTEYGNVRNRLASCAFHRTAL